MAGYWLLGIMLDVYEYPVVGAIFELLWLPMLAALFILPIISLVFLVKTRFNLGSFYLSTIIICILILLLLFYFKA